ncbi:uncharacterized protein LOC128953672 [Oppia nitens]|uniref:uncharacterized protein LOC128953672 n=1 Tax=Oppia nitens TaxID=1686743 RepID=UPI0023DB8B87|nr:uncharacterized protein LOC128953672 [Oppia nitens]
MAYIIYSITIICLCISNIKTEYRPDMQKNIFRALNNNKGIFDFGFSTTYVGEDPFTFEHFLFIRHHFWKVKQTENDEKEVCIEDLESEQHSEFNHRFTLAFSYLSDHMVQHDDELNLTNHVFLQLTLKSSEYYAEFESHELIENIFDANHKDLYYMVGGDYYPFFTHYFNATAAFQPQSFTDDGETDGPNFVFIQQNITVEGLYERLSEVHSIIDNLKIRNTTEKFGKYIPPFIAQVDPRLYINSVLPMRLGGDIEEGKPAAILILLDEGIIKYCVTDEQVLDESCNPSNLRQLLRCSFSHEEL